MNISKIAQSAGVTLSLILLIFNIGTSQQASGLFLENYSGIHGVVKNPASGQHGKLGWDINLASANFYFQNDYAYAANSNFFHFLRNTDSLSILGLNEQVVDPDEFGILFFENDKNKSAYGHLDIMGPSAWIELNPISIGLFTRFRAESSIAKIPSILGYNNYQNLTLNQVQSLESIQSAGAMWSEYGLSLSSNAFWYDDISAGINIKYLVGHEGYYLSSPNNLNLIKTDDQIQLNSAVATVAYTEGIADQNNINRSKKGRGFAIDLGYSQTFERSKLGIAILDLGQMNFNTNAETHRIVVNDTLSLNVNDINNQSTLSSLIQLAENNLIAGDSSMVSNSFKVETPVRLAINFDYQLSKNVFINTAVIQSLGSSDNAIKSENNIAISPRYESRWFTITTPIVISNYERVKVGFATRLGLLTLGSDNVLSLFGKNNLSGSSVYAAVKINPFNYGGKKGRGVNCPKVKRSPWDSAKPNKGAKRMTSPG